MALKYNNQAVNVINYNGNDVKVLIKDGVTVWCKPFSLSITNGSYGTVTRTATNEPSASTGDLSNGSTIYYGDTLTATPETTTAQYSYTVNTSSLTVDGNESFTFTRTLRSYTITLAKGGSNYGSWSKASMTAYYGDKIALSGNTVTIYQGTGSTTRDSSTFTNSSATGYTYSVSYGTVPTSCTGAATITATTSRTANTYTLAGSVTNGAISFRNSSNTTITQAAYDSTIKVVVNPNAHYEYVKDSTRYYNGSPYVIASITLNDTNFTMSGNTMTVKNATVGVPTLTEITYTYSMSSSNSTYCYYGASAPNTGNTSAVTSTWANRASTTVYYKINPNERYYCQAFANYHDHPYSGTLSGDNFTFTDSNKTATYNKACTALEYTLTATSSNGTVTVGKTASYTASITGTYADLTGRSIYYKITPSSYYYYSSATYTNSNPYTATLAGTGWSYSDANRTATKAFDACSAFNYTIQEYTRTGGTVTWCATSNGTYSTTLTAAYGSTVYWKFTPSTEYNAPSTASGNMTLNSTNFTLSTSTAAGNATYKGSAIGNGSRKTYTITFSKGGSNKGSWNSSSGTAQYGDIISRSGNTVTVYKWDATSTARFSSTFTDATGYSTSFSSLTTPITAAQTVTATTTAITYTLAGSVTNGAISFRNSSNNAITTATYDSTIKVVVNPNSYYEYVVNSSTRYYHGSPYVISNITLNDTNFTLSSGPTATVKNATVGVPTLTAITYTYSITSANSDYCYYSKTNSSPSSAESITATYANRPTTMYCKINALEHFDVAGDLSYENGTPKSYTLTSSSNPALSWTFSDSAKTGKMAIDCTAVVYDVQLFIDNGECKIGTTYGTWTWSVGGTYATLSTQKIYYKITPDDYYYFSSSTYHHTNPYSNSSSGYINGSSLVYSKGTGGLVLQDIHNYYGVANCTPFNYTIQSYSRTGGTVTWSTSQNGTYSATLTAAYGSTVWWKFTADTAYNAPSTASGSVVLTEGNFSFTTSTAAGNATYIGSDIGNGTRKTLTVTFSRSGSYGSWSNASLSCQYGDQIQRSGDTVTIYKWDATSTARGSSTFTNGSATGYTYSLSYTNAPTTKTAINNTSYTVTATTSRTANTYTLVAGTVSNGAMSFINTSGTAITQATYDSTVRVVVTPNAHYEYKVNDSTRYYNGSPYTFDVTLNTTNFTLNGSNATKNSTGVPTLTEITYTYSVSSSNSAYCYYGASAPSSANTTAVTGTYAQRANKTIYYKINPNVHYYCNSTSNYNGVPYSSSVGGGSCTFYDSNKTAVYPKNCAAITYTLSMQVWDGSVDVSLDGNSYSDTLSGTYAYLSNSYILYKVTPDWNFYYISTSYDLTYPYYDSIYGNNFTFNDANRTAFSNLNNAECTPFNCDIQSYSRTGGTVTWSSDGTNYSTTLQDVPYYSQIYWKFTPSTGYNAPATASGVVDLDTDNFDFGTHDGCGDTTVSYKGSAIGNGTRKSYTITFSKGGDNYGSWSTASATAYYGDYIQRSGDTVTIYKWDATSTARFTSTFGSYNATGYTTSVSYTNASTTKTQLNRDSAYTVTATTSRTINSYAVNIYKSTGISSVYTSTSSSATSGNASGTTYNYNTTVYGFVVLSDGYNAKSGWTLVSGTANTSGAKYCVGSVTVPASAISFNNGTAYTADIKTYTLTITKNSNVSTIYYKINGATSWSSTTSSTTKSINWGSSIYYYVSPATGYYSAQSSSTTLATNISSDQSLSPTVSRIAATFNKNSITGISSYTCYRKLYNGSSFSSISNGATIYYGDELYFVATPQSGYIAGYYQNCYKSGAFVYTCAPSQGATLNGSSFVQAYYVGDGNNLQINFPYVGEIGSSETFHGEFSIFNDSGYDMRIVYLQVNTFENGSGRDWVGDIEDEWDTYGWSDSETIIDRDATWSYYGASSSGNAQINGGGNDSGYLWWYDTENVIYVRQYQMHFYFDNGSDYCYHANEMHYFTPVLYVTKSAGVSRATVTYVPAGNYTLTGYSSSSESYTMSSSTDFWVEYGTSYSVSNIQYNSYYESTGATYSGSLYDNTSITLASRGILYTLTQTANNCAVTYYSDYNRTTQITTARYGTTVYYNVNPNTYYYYSSTTYYHNNPYKSSKSVGANGSMGTFTATAITYTFSIVSSNASYVYYNTSGSPTSATTITATYANRPSYVYFKINPAEHYYCSSETYKHGTPYSASVSGSSFTFSDQYRTATYTKNCTALTFTYSMTCTNGTATVGTTNGSYYSSVSATYGSTTIYFKVTPNNYYYYSSSMYGNSTPYTSFYSANSTSWTFSDSNKTATMSKTCTVYTYKPTKTITGGTVLWSSSQITTSGGSTTGTYNYGSTVYWRIEPTNSYYYTPTPYYGSMTLNSSYFTLSTSPGSNGTNATYNKYQIVKCSGTGSSSGTQYSINYTLNSGSHNSNYGYHTYYRSSTSSSQTVELGTFTRPQYTLSTVTSTKGTISGSNTVGWTLSIPANTTGIIRVTVTWSGGVDLCNADGACAARAGFIN